MLCIWGSERRLSREREESVRGAAAAEQHMMCRGRRSEFSFVLLAVSSSLVPRSFSRESASRVSRVCVACTLSRARARARASEQAMGYGLFSRVVLQTRVVQRFCVRERNKSHTPVSHSSLEQKQRVTAQLISAHLPASRDVFAAGYYMSTVSTLLLSALSDRYHHRKMAAQRALSMNACENEVERSAHADKTMVRAFRASAIRF